MAEANVDGEALKCNEKVDYNRALAKAYKQAGSTATPEFIDESCDFGMGFETVEVPRGSIIGIFLGPKYAKICCKRSVETQVNIRKR